MEHANNLPIEATAAPATAATVSPLARTGNGTSYAVGGLICLIVGLFFLGGPCALGAITLGGKAVRNGTVGFGNIIRVIAWIELAVMLLYMVVKL